MRNFDQLTPPGRTRRLRKLALYALGQYDLNWTRIKLVSNEVNGIFLVVTPTDRWILRVTLPEGGHTPDHVAAEMEWLASLAKDTTISVPKPLQARNGAYLVEASAAGVPEPRLCEIFSWVPGTDLANHFTLENIYRLGELSARLHEHAQSFEPSPQLELLAFDRVFYFPERFILFEKSFQDFINHSQSQLFREWIERAQKAIDQLKASGEPMRIVHGDLHQWNVRFSKGILSPIDFEDLMLAWPVQDIAISQYYFQDEPGFPEMRTSFQRGYERVSPWPEKERGEIDAFIAARGIGLLNFVLHNYKMLEMDPREFAGRIENRLKLLFKE